MKFKLVPQEEDFIYKPDKRFYSFYQICKFTTDCDKIPANQRKYHIRKIVFDEYSEIDHRQTKTKFIKKYKLDVFLTKCPTYKYTLYSTYNLDVVGLPDPNEILTAQSQILNNMQT